MTAIHSKQKYHEHQHGQNTANIHKATKMIRYILQSTLSLNKETYKD